jgi:multicomponent Na+:H+ antiporter subunit D
MEALLLSINPGLWLILAGMLCAVLPYQARKWVMTAVPVFAGFVIFGTYAASPDGMTAGIIPFGDNELITYRTDNLSRIWAYIFCFAGFLNGIYSWHEKAKMTDTMALIYQGAALAAVLVGDLLTLFIFWELTVISSVFLIWAGGPKSYNAGIRYLVWHILSGVLLLAGAVMYANANGGDYTFNYIGLDAPGGWLILLGIGIKCGFPLLHMWIEDAYPKASVTGTVILSAFTTKLAIYALARGFAGTDILIYVGAVMTVFPVFFAVIENDLRRVLSYSLNNQLGFMVCAIGIGTPLALNGAAAHVSAHVVYKALLFMSMGAVLHRVGTVKASELGGLFRTMPFTAIFCLIGSASIAAFPLFSGFVTKSMILSAALYDEQWIALGMLIFASAGVMEHSGIKIPFFSFFAHDSGMRPPEAPTNMLVAMFIAAAFCIGISMPGVYPLLYTLLPDPDLGYHPYTTEHVVFELQIMFAAMFAFAFLKRLHIYPPERRAEILDVDVLYRKVGYGLMGWIGAMLDRLGARLRNLRGKLSFSLGRRLFNIFSPAGGLAAAAPVSLPAVLVATVLLVVMIVAYIAG